jgi:PAPA-1-like conserved region
LKDDDEYDDSHDGDGAATHDMLGHARQRRWLLSCFVGCVHVPHSFSSTYPAIGSIDETSRKKKQLNEAEIALRRDSEETARKRKHLSEKELEDEKVRVHTNSHFLLSV